MKGVRLEDVRRAWEARDPELASLIVALANAPDEVPDEPVPEGALTYQQFIGELRSWRFMYKSDEEKQHYRVESFKELEENDRLPDRLWVHEIVEALWEDNGAYAREQLLELIATCPLKWGPWRALKRIFKQAEARNDTEIMGALSARIDAMRAGYSYGDVSVATQTYMVRRAWRYLRRLGQTFPSRYADAAVDFLRFYPEDTSWRRTWVANHVFFHETRQYGQSNFTYWWMPDDLIGKRAFAEAWQRTPRPLFTLLERANAEKVRQFAIEALKTDFRTVLREVEASWVARLAHVESASAHDFVVWILKNVPKFDQASFRAVGLHEAVLLLLESPSNDARVYAAQYARTHARDLELEHLLRLANNSHDQVRKLAFDLIRELDPREEVGLDAWGRLLGTEHGHKIAQDALRKHFGASELTPGWFRERLLGADWRVVQFAQEQLLRVHTPAQLGASYFTELFDEERLEQNAANFALTQLMEHFAVSAVDEEFWRRSLLHPLSSYQVRNWMQEGKLEASAFGVDYWKALSYHPTWEADAWISELKESERSWTTQLEFDESLAQFARRQLGDVRQFSPAEVGLDWLMELVGRLEGDYHHFAVNYLLKAFVPADFAPRGEGEDATQAGCERLWEMITSEGEPDEPLRQFAMTYVRHHHAELGQALTDQPVEARAQMPQAFFSFERVGPLLRDERRALRKLACDIGHWELARWSPPLHEIVELCELPYADVTEFFEEAFMAPELKETQAYRLGREHLTVDGVYRFCESLDRGTRRIGMALIARYKDLAEPEALFRLTESPDRQVRAFVIRTIWALYRDRGITMHWEPLELEKRFPQAKTKKGLQQYETGPGPQPRPGSWPAPDDALNDFMRRILYGIPPAKLSREEADAADAEEQEGQQGAEAQGSERKRRVRPVPARVAKKALIEVMRDLALEERGFAAHIAPLLAEFMHSLGKSERAACLVALTRINRAWPDLEVLPEGVEIAAAE